MADLTCNRGFVLEKNTSTGELKPFFVKVRKSDIVNDDGTPATFSEGGGSGGSGNSNLITKVNFINAPNGIGSQQYNAQLVTSIHGNKTYDRGLMEGTTILSYDSTPIPNTPTSNIYEGQVESSATHYYGRANIMLYVRTPNFVNEYINRQHGKQLVFNVPFGFIPGLCSLSLCDFGIALKTKTGTYNRFLDINRGLQLMVISSIRGQVINLNKNEDIYNKFSIDTSPVENLSNDIMLTVFSNTDGFVKYSDYDFMNSREVSIFFNVIIDGIMRLN